MRLVVAVVLVVTLVSVARAQHLFQIDVNAGVNHSLPNSLSG